MLWILVLCIFELICSSYTADPEEVYGRKGSSYTFVCPHRKTSHNNVHWAFINKSGSYFVISEGTFIVSIYRDRVDVVGNHSIGEYNLKLSGLQESDEGTYTCGASRQRKSYNFELLVAPSALVLYNTINDTILSTEGKSLTINCTAIGGNPEPDLKLDVDSQVVTGKQSVILAIPALEKTHDKQLVKCQAVHDGLQTPLERNASLYLYLKPSVPVFSTDTPRTNETEQLIVSCTSTGSRPAGVIYWKLKSKMLSSRFIQQNNFDSLTETFTILSTLTYSLDRSLNGQPITCGVTHQTLRQVLETTKTVNVNYPPNVTVSDVTYNQTDDNRTLQCNLEGNPTKYTYFKWKHKSKYGVMIRELHGSQDGILTLPDVPESERYQDSGEYICIAGNGIGDRHGNIQQKGYGHVTINAQPVFTKDNKNIRTQYGETGKDVSIYIYVYSVPKHTTIKWFKLNREIFQSVKYSMAEEYVIVHHGFYGKEVQLDGFRIKVTINLLRYEDFSNYTLKVSNEFGHYVQHEIMLKYGVTDQGPLSQNSDQNSTSQPVFVVGLTLTLATILLWTVLGFIYYRRKLAAKRVQLPIKDAKDPISTSGDTRRREEDSIPEM